MRYLLYLNEKTLHVLNAKMVEQQQNGETGFWTTVETNFSSGNWVDFVTCTIMPQCCCFQLICDNCAVDTADAMLTAAGEE